MKNKWLVIFSSTSVVNISGEGNWDKWTYCCSFWWWETISQDKIWIREIAHHQKRLLEYINCSSDKWSHHHNEKNLSTYIFHMSCSLSWPSPKEGSHDRTISNFPCSNTYSQHIQSLAFLFLIRNTVKCHKEQCEQNFTEPNQHTVTYPPTGNCAPLTPLWVFTHLTPHQNGRNNILSSGRNNVLSSAWVGNASSNFLLSLHQCCV